MMKNEQASKSKQTLSKKEKKKKELDDIDSILADLGKCCPLKQCSHCEGMEVEKPESKS